ncbi:MAG: domain containing protein, partial [Bacteroidetes bacterium]|nr:domain containing protein [Bacteroidota bacterium]
PVTHNYTAAGVYTVTLTKSGGPSCEPAIQSLTVEVYPTPSSTLSVNSPVCYGGTASFTNTQTNGAVFQWSGPNNYSSNVQNPVITSITASNSGLYTCTITSSNGCTAVSSINLSTYQATVSAGSNGPVCAGNVLNLSAGGSGTYSWSGPNSFTSNAQNPSFTPAGTLASGNYSVMATLSGNCYASATLAVIVNTTAVTAGNSSPICFGNNMTLNATGNGSFVWNGPNGFTSNLQTVNLTSPATTAAGVYTVTITSPEGCTASATTAVIIQAPKVLNPKATSSVCEGGTLYFEALDGSGATYQWIGPNNYSSGNANTAIQEAVPANSGQYTLTVKDVYGCTASAKVNVHVAPKPTLDIDMSKAIAGCAPLCNVEFLAKGSSNITEFNWSFGNGANSSVSNPAGICYNAAGIFTVSLMGKDVNGCDARVSKVLEVFPTPKAEFSFVNGPTWTTPETKFKDESTGATIAEWKWTFGNGPDANSSSQHPNYTYPDSGSYNVTLKVISNKGCESMISKKVKINDEMGLYVPNAFTPNNDGSNDVFLAVSNNVNKFEMQIFNRWGALVFQSSDIRKGWDGTYKGALAESAVYVYKINYTNKDAKMNTLTGNVTLIR